jgi:hypothetical protein
MAWQPIILIIAVPLFATFMFFAISKVLGSTTGWKKLAETYSLEQSGERVDDVSFTSSSGRMRSMSFKNVFDIGANDQGVALRSSFFFRAGFATLFIPWQAVDIERAGIRVVSDTSFGRLSTTGYSTLRVTTHPEFEMKIRERDIRRSSIAPYLNDERSDRVARS